MLNSARIIVLDGHDGCGKSTLARHFSKLTGRILVKPFADSLGDHIAWLWQNRRFEEADHLSRTSIERVLEKHPGPLVFDRHWATMFTVLPEHLWPRWGELPATVLCTAGLDTIAARLAGRGEEVGDLDEHDYYLARYLKVVEHCPRHLILDTERFAITECLSRITSFAEGATDN